MGGVERLESPNSVIVTYRVCKVVRFCRETPTNYISGERARLTDHEYGKFFEKFSKFQKFWGSEISDISKSGFFLHAHKNPTIYRSFKSACHTDFKNVKKNQKI